MRIILLLSLVTFSVAAQVAVNPPTEARRYGAVENVVSHPSIGWLSITTPPEIRPVLGFSSAARVGEPIALPSGTTASYMAPRQIYALLSASELLVMNLATFETRSLGPALSREPLFSPSGTSVALPLESDRVAVWTGLPHEPSLHAEVAVPPSATSVALSDANDIAYAVEGRLHLSDSSTDVELAGPAFLSFVPGSNELVAGMQNGRVLAISALNGQSSVRIVAEIPQCDMALKGFVAREGEPVLLLACGTELTRVNLSTGSVSSHSLLSAIKSPIPLPGGRSAIAAGASIHDAAEVITIRGDKTESFLVPAVAGAAAEVQQ